MRAIDWAVFDALYAFNPVQRRARARKSAAPYVDRHSTVTSNPSMPDLRRSTPNVGRILPDI